MRTMLTSNKIASLGESHHILKKCIYRCVAQDLLLLINSYTVDAVWPCGTSVFLSNTSGWAGERMVGWDDVPWRVYGRRSCSTATEAASLLCAGRLHALRTMTGLGTRWSHERERYLHELSGIILMEIIQMRGFGWSIPAGLYLSSRPDS